MTVSSSQFRADIVPAMRHDCTRFQDGLNDANVRGNALPCIMPRMDIPERFISDLELRRQNGDRGARK
ncbi:MAG TPA: hypothetical protein VMJ90_06440, partial [Anaerolineales bacterium]|nr:hypothetical protein [Anaerolineales bacterium]